MADTGELTERDLALVRALVDGAFGAQFSDHDWDHALGGIHVMLVDAGVPLSHASVVSRTLLAGDRSLHAGYVEAVATQPVCRNQGYGSTVMREVNAVIERGFDLGALSTGVGDFYVRLGWEKWRGNTFVTTTAGERRRTADEDDGIYVLRTSRTVDLELGTELTCEDRLGDAW